jgi:tRNA A37 methylthiotransferase MiaB
MNPNNVFLILDELLSIFEDEKVYKFLHIPIQSNSEKVLKSMRRPYSPEIPEKIISEFRKKFPSITIATDLIVGYPNETNEEFKKTLTFIKEKKPDVLNLSKFSLHKGTSIYEEILSKNLKLVSIKIVNKRNTEIMEEHRKTALENKKKFLGSSTKVFVNRKISEGIYESRDENYNIVLINSNDKSLLGKFLNVMITKIGVHHMFGELE